MNQCIVISVGCPRVGWLRPGVKRLRCTEDYGEMLKDGVICLLPRCGRGR